VRGVGGAAKVLHTGYVRTYALIIALGAVGVVAAMLLGVVV